MEEQKLISANIEDEMRRSYLDYAMSVIIGRALPDVRDGFKPVHRRVLWTMHELGNSYNKPYKKSARVVGDCFVAGELVHTERGLRPIEDIEIGDRVVLPDGRTSEVVEAFHNPPLAVVDVTFSNGHTMTVTPGQLFRVLNDDLTIGWERAENLGGKRVLASSHHRFGAALAHPDKRMADLAYVVGLFVAEGFQTDRGRSKRVGIHMTDPEPLDVVADVCAQRGVRASRSVRAPQQPGYSLQNVLRFTGIPEVLDACETTCATKEVPRWILDDRRLFAPFLAGFLDGDGCIRTAGSKREVVLVSTSATLLRQMQAMLADRGIHVRYANGENPPRERKKTKLPFRTLYATGVNASRLCELVADHLRIPRKRDAARQLADWSKRELSTESECLPGKAVFAELSNRHLGGGWYLDAEGHKFRDGITYPDGTKIRYSSDLMEKDLSFHQIEDLGIRAKLDRIGSPLADRLTTLTATYSVLTATSVENRNETRETYDIQIADAEHEFLVHGFAVHNCIGKYHPHGDSAVYETIVRLVQPFSMRAPLVDGQGNFGCFTGDTKIKLLDGTEKTFEELARLPKDEVFHVYSVDSENRIVVGEGRHSRITRKNAEIIEVTLDNGARIRCTPDHRFMLRDGSYKAAEDLTPEDSLMPGYFDTAPVKKGLNKYLRVQQPLTGEYEFVHVLADRFNAERGMARQFNGPFVRHHKNFNWLDNRPSNIERMDFLEHLHVHAEQIKELWEDETFRAAQKAGVQKYYAENPDVIEQRRKRFIDQNQNEEFRRENGKRVGASLKLKFENDPTLGADISTRMKSLWSDPEYRLKMSEALRNLKKRTLSKEEKLRIGQIISEKSRAMWGNEDKRAEIVAAISRALARTEVREKIKAATKKNWENPDYRSKYTDDHHSKMAKILWESPETREFHRDKIKRQWENPEFKSAQRQGVQQSNARRMEANPEMMKRLTASASASLKQRWRDPVHREQVIRQRIARFGSQLLMQIGRENFTREAYEKHRNAGWIPRLDTALTYFHSFEEIIKASETYNHRIVCIQKLDERVDVYDITVDVHHNFLLADGVFVHNSVDGDSAAAMRYTEVRLARISEAMLADIDKETVDFQPNYDESQVEPKVLPARFPNLLVNGSSGIAVGMATNIPPHNLTEVIDATIMLINKPQSTLADLMKVIQGPDFPTGGYICGRNGILQAFTTGRGSVTMRARAAIDYIGKNGGERQAIVVTELPYQVNKAKLVEKIAELITEKKIEDISDLRDESDREGMRIVIELKRSAIAQVVLNNLYKLTQMQTNFGIINLAIVNGQPKVLNLIETLHHFIEHRKDVVRRRTIYELKKAEARAHILEGLKKALDQMDAIIKLIRAAKSPAEAREGLMTQHGFTQIQAQAILDMQLQKLTGLERQKIVEEYEAIIKRIAELNEILANESVLKGVIIKELQEVKKDFGDPRRTQILDEETEFRIEDLIPDEEVVITITHGGYIKRTPLSSYRTQRRGGSGRRGMATKAEDVLDSMFIASTHAYMMIFTDKGQVYKVKVHEIPDAATSGRGKAIVNLVELPQGEKVAGMFPVREFSEGRFVVMVTRKGIIKKTELSEYANIRSNGIIAMGIDEDDELIAIQISNGSQKILISTHDGQAIQFKETDVRPMGRPAQGVIGINLRDKDFVVGVSIVNGDEHVLAVSELGLGKRTPVSEYPIQGRGGVGVINMKITDRTGGVVTVLPVTDDDQLMVITSQGQVVRVEVKPIRETGRAAQGVKVINLGDGDKVVSASLIESESETVAEDAKK